MPFEVFRRYQKKILAFLAISAMILFTVDLSLVNLFKFQGGAGKDEVITNLYNQPIRASTLQPMLEQRSTANIFMTQLMARFAPFAMTDRFFGGLTTRELMDGLILQQEADKLGLPKPSSIMARKWLDQVTDGRMDAKIFEEIRARMPRGLSGEQLLTDLASQIRLQRVRLLGINAELTPLDLFQKYREQAERVSVNAIVVPVSKFLKTDSGNAGSKVVSSIAQADAKPTATEIQSFYEKYRGQLADPLNGKPGFRVPRRIRVSVLTADRAAITEQIEKSIADNAPELIKAYEERRKEFVAFPPAELPVDVFADDPQAELTPRPLEEIKTLLKGDLARAKANEEVENKFLAIKEGVMDPFSDAYGEALIRYEEANQIDAEKANTMPAPPIDELKSFGLEDELNKLSQTFGVAEKSLPIIHWLSFLLEKAAEKQGVKYEQSGLLPGDKPEAFGPVGTALIGQAQAAGSKTFTDQFFDPRSPLFEPIELSDAASRGFLAWKVEDIASYIPTLKDVEPQVIFAIRTEKAREQAKQEAEKLQKLALADGGDLKKLPGNETMITTIPIAKMTPDPLNRDLPRPSEILELPNAGKEVRDAIFTLEPGKVAVALDQAKENYYLLSLAKREPADVAKLYNPSDSLKSSLQSMAVTESQIQSVEGWMNELRLRAGLAKDWVPLDEKKASKDGHDDEESHDHEQDAQRAS